MKAFQVHFFSQIVISIQFKPKCAFSTPNKLWAQRLRVQSTSRVPLIHCVASHNQETGSSFETVWLTNTEVDALSGKLNQSHAEIAAIHTDVASYFDGYDKSSRDCIDRTKPFRYRLNKHSKLLKETTAMALSSDGGNKVDDQTHMTTKAQEVAELTLRWCDHFVRALNLCPWAKLSLMSENGIRIKIVPQSMGLHMMERIIRESSEELVRVTDIHRGGNVDINAAITFVVAIMDRNPNGFGCAQEFEFESFYNFCTDLEDHLFDEADEAQESKGKEAVEGSAILIGDEVTIAPFHPDWYFSTGELENDIAMENPLDYEKKSPYPTISLVRTSVIEQAGEDATHQIGTHNEKVLKDFGVNKLKELYNDRILGKSNEK